MITECPICKSEASELPRTGDADGFDCPTHGKFKVADTVLKTCWDKATDEWERALAKAKLRTESDEWPTIITDDFS